MDQFSNFLSQISAPSQSPSKSPFKIMNHTMSSTTVEHHNETDFLNGTLTDDVVYMNFRSTNSDTNNDLYVRLGYGNMSDVNTQMMISLISIGSFLLILIGFQFARQVSFVLQNTPSKYMARTLILCGIYTITGTAAFVSLVIYRAAVLCDSICHFAFLLCAYQFFTLVIDYYGGESEFMKHTNGLMVFNLQTPPCCCCLRFLLPSELTKEKFRSLRIMVLQMPIIQGFLLFLLNVFNSIDPILHSKIQPFFMPLMVSSILTGVWALQINSRMFAKYLPDHKIMQKYFAIQLVLICYKFQPAVLQALCIVIESITEYRIQSKVVENGVIQLLILLETVALAFFANHIYRVPNDKETN